MALVACSECGSEVSEKAASCPKCGNPGPFVHTPEAGSEARVRQHGDPVAEAGPRGERVNRKRVLLTGVVVFVVYMMMAVLVHGAWLGPSYTSLMGDVWRPQAELTAKAWITQSTTAIFCFIFAYLFARGYRGGGWREGIWFGLVTYFFAGFQAVTHAYATYPIPLDLALKWFFAGLPISILIGILASLVYKKG